jgi:hypothetical protein
MAVPPSAALEVSEFLAEEVSKILDVPPPERDGPWAYEACRLSREMHLAVWQSCPEPQYVRDRVIALLHRLLDALRALASKPPQVFGMYDQYVADFASNVEERIQNLMNYVEGRPSAFAPEAKLHDPVGEEHNSQDGRG